ncbi:4-aminobutyrate transaminase [Plesiocystis pacifica SIR-1]|uniref:4-aminobutyrate transaminase n=1 Tax=Plesiocystis pacifica SIR-1 TaxID=391625 RepID=A6G011_9BACT|nr:aminotransferase class III-fold pyridoxal phosphate-dependent enzyme [Plesiocystis pacifica]EDM80708.1 4-aminobutyrate transaminase [Plesiocystis pacifica SIR-1]
MTTEPMTSDEMIQTCLEHTMFSWTATGKVSPLPIARAEGVYMYTPEGKRILDFNSQLMCVNVGHGHPKVIAAMKQAAEGLTYVFPGAATEPRARLAKRLAELCPGDIDTFFFTLSGAESNENAIKAARLFTGRFKILSSYRSYHGATNACMQLTGDPRRIHNEPGSPGFVHVMPPWPYDYSFGDDEEQITAQHLRYLEETIMYEGPETIAAMFVETVTGTNGILPPPKGWLQGLRALLDRYGILMVCDEVMCGWGRTGKLFAVEHYDVVPDILTMAKGLTSSYVPLGAMGVRRKIAEHFREHVFWGGLTYNAHAYACAVALAAIDVLVGEGMVENAAKQGAVMREEMDRLIAKHPSAREGRCIGLFGMMDVQKNAAGESIAPYNGTHPAMGRLAQFFRDEGLFTFVRWGSFMCNPPLCITEEQLREGFAIIDRGLDITDEVYEG